LGGTEKNWYEDNVDCYCGFLLVLQVFAELELNGEEMAYALEGSYLPGTLQFGVGRDYTAVPNDYIDVLLLGRVI